MGFNKPIRININVSDDWLPTRDDGTVTFSAYMKDHFCCCWGDDDFGLERSFNDRISTLNFFKKVKKKHKAGYIFDQNFFITKGFTSAAF